MKTSAKYRHLSPRPLPYPNAATGRELLHRFLDLLLCAACGMGTAVTLLLLLVLF